MVWPERMFVAAAAASSLLLCGTPMVSAIQYFNCPNPIEPMVVKGKRFFNAATGAYFAIQGIAYYPRPNDGELINSNSVDFFTDQYRDLWAADIANFVQLGVNVVRIYAVDPSQSHDAFMCALQTVGIYVMIDLLADCEECAIGITTPPDCYPVKLKNRGQWIINVFSKYTNTLTFSAGNEVTIFADEIADNAPCQKKFLRDMRAYIQKCRTSVPNSILSRAVPVGMVNWDSERQAQTLYFNCRTNSSDVYEEAEWYGLNAYQHCDPTAQTIGDLRGWIRLRNDFASYNLPVPVVIAEFGCRTSGFPTIDEFAAQRDWLQIDALYSASYTNVFAGGVAFEYSAEKRQADGSRQQTPWPYYDYAEYQFGVGYYTPIDCDHADTPCTYIPYPEFDRLAQRLANVDVSYAETFAEYRPSGGQLPQCPTVYAAITDFVWPSDTSPDEVCYVVGTNAPTTMSGPSLNSTNTTKAPTVSPEESSSFSSAPSTPIAEPTATRTPTKRAPPVTVPVPTTAPTLLLPNAAVDTPPPISIPTSLVPSSSAAAAASSSTIVIPLGGRTMMVLLYMILAHQIVFC
jgi:1,3-beta-glucanosyltransferase GAS5